MLRKTLVALTLALFTLALPFQTVSTVKAQRSTLLADNTPSQVAIIQVKAVDLRAVILRDYLAKRNSDLQYHAQDFIDAADRNQMDWRLVAAICGVESNFGKQVPGGTGAYTSYNGWGWGVYGTQALYFNSWTHGIDTVSDGLKKDYIDKGLTTPAAMNKKYASSPSWGWKVQFFLDDIEKFAETYPEYSPEKSKLSSLGTPVAAASARLSYQDNRLVLAP